MSTIALLESRSNELTTVQVLKASRHGVDARVSRRTSGFVNQPLKLAELRSEPVAVYFCLSLTVDRLGSSLFSELQFANSGSVQFSSVHVR